MPEPFIIKVRYGGLGDHLFWSHLPRIAKTVGGYERVYISNLSEYRHPDYRKLVWELNPFVDGFCDEDVPSADSLVVSPGMNLLDRIMIERGLNDGKCFHEPELFYEPNLKPELVSARVFDPNYISYVGKISRRKLIQFIDATGGIDFQMRVRGKAFNDVRGVPTLDTVDIFDYCDVIASCKTFLCLTSGGATLAAALGKPCIAFYGYGQKSEFWHSRLHKYVNVSPPSTEFMHPISQFFRRAKMSLTKLRSNSKFLGD